MNIPSLPVEGRDGGGIGSVYSSLCSAVVVITATVIKELTQSALWAQAAGDGYQTLAPFILITTLFGSSCFHQHFMVEKIIYPER